MAFLVIAGGIISIQSAFATHIRAGEITVTRKSCTFDFIITIAVYTNTSSPIKFSNNGSGELNFHDGSPIFHPPEEIGNPVPGFGPQFGYVKYSTSHTFPGPGQYTISYFEHNRNGGILNMFNSIETPFYIETVINIDPFLCDSSPRLLVPPIDQACTGAAWYHNPGAYDPNGDSLSFELTIPKQNVNQDVNAYRPPNTKEFYDDISLNYGTSNEAQNGSPTFSINPITGTIIWDAPGAPGEYNIAFIIKEWRKVGGNWVQLGYVTRDMQIIVQDCQNKRPELTVPPDICVDAGTIINQKIFGTDPNYDSVKIEAFSQVFSITPSPAKFTPSPAVFQLTANGVDASGTFNWVTVCEHVKEQPYQVVFKITDSPPKGNGASLVQFKTWNIKVVGPAPIWESAQVNPGQRKANLKWKKYHCSNAMSVQIWRRIDSNPFVPPQCVTGMPDFLGYTLIDLVSAQDSTYTDTNAGAGLAQGASYCYRLVALFPLPEGGESYVSQEICLPPILANAPIVTNVTIDITDQANGRVTVKWRPPFDVSPIQFPPPYQYKVYRAEGFSWAIKLDTVYAGWRPDTVWVDTGLDTKETVYNYRIVAYDNNHILIDTSSTASSVRLELKPQLKEIELNWNAVVPWSNHTLQNPLHLIFRGPANSKESDLTLIDSVDVNEKSFHYIDSGLFQGIKLKQTDTYCYRVLTRGGYGNPKIKQPLLNYSQIICAQPNDTIRPCKPALSIKAVDCKQYLLGASCAPNTFSNTLTWNLPTNETCRAETKTFNIYIAGQVGSAFQLYAQNVKDTFFIDANLPSFARCYKISAVSRSGIESVLSESFCFDNCPSYGLPNVFTPNGDKCNELFSAFSERYAVSENGDDACGPVQNAAERKLLCARFVNQVNFTVYNRWGKAVFTYASGGERTIYIDWNGKDDNGADVAAGVYFYIAVVNFNVVDPSKQNKTFKGWVQVIRGNQ